MLLAGGSHPNLAAKLAFHLECELLQMQVEMLSTGEIILKCNGSCELDLHDKVKGKIVYILQTGKGNSQHSLNDFLMELLLLIRFCAKASAARISAVIPCFPYARQDKQQLEKCQEPITAKLIAQMLQVAGASEMISVDLHSLQIQGFFSIPIDKLSVDSCMAECILRERLFENAVIVSPDVGGMSRATSIASRLNLEVAVIYKERTTANNVSRMLLVGKVAGKVAIIVDDIVDTCGTLELAVQTCLENGALQVHAMAVHGILSGNAIQRIEHSRMNSLMLTNSVALQAEDVSKKIRIIDISKLLSQAISNSFDRAKDTEDS